MPDMLVLAVRGCETSGNDAWRYRKQQIMRNLSFETQLLILRNLKQVRFLFVSFIFDILLDLIALNKSNEIVRLVRMSDLCFSTARYTLETLP